MTCKPKILIVDDKKENLVALRQVLKEVDAELIEASNGNDALAATLHHEFALGLLDVQMPGMNGFELAEYLRGDKAAGAFPLVFLTAAYGDEQQVFKGYKAGAIDYLTKPYASEVLLGKVRIFLEMDRYKRELLEHRERLEALVEERTKELELELAGHKEADKALLESEERYRAVSEYSNNAICIINEAGRIVWGNAQMTVMGGYSLQEYLGAESFARFIAPESLDFVGMNFRKFASGQPYEHHYMFTFVRKNGEHRFCEKYMTDYLDKRGRRNLVISMIDVTERRKAEEELGRRSGVLNSLVEHIPVGVFMVEAPSGKPVFANNAALKILGRGILGDATKDNLAEVYKAVRMPAKTPYPPEEMPILLGMQGITSHISDMAVVRPDGTETILEVFGSPVRDAGGKVWASLVSFQDITERKKSEAERERLLKAIEQAGEIFFVTDPQGVIQYVNPAFERVTGYSRAEVLGLNPRILKSGKQDAAFYREMWNTLLSGKTYECRMVNKRKDGTLYTEESTISPVRDPGGRVVNYVAVTKDITDQLRLESQFLQSQKMEVVGVLAGGVAHDFNNILTAIRSYADFMYKALPAADPMRSDAQEIMTASDRAAALTRQLLAFSRRQLLSPRSVDLNKVVGDMTKMLARLIGEDIRLETKLAHAPCLAMVDPGQIEQVVMNLAVNARDAMPNGGRITLETAVVAAPEAEAEQLELPPGPAVRMKIADTGCGMTDEVKARIFEPFFNPKPPSKGKGLGLPTVIGIIKQSGGDIVVQSEPGKGTVFSIYLPLLAAAAPAAADETPKAAPASYSETILLVEDDEMLRRLGERLLKEIGYTVISAPSGTAALEAAEKLAKPVDLLLTDVVMPGLSGRDLARELERRKLAPRTLYMSGYTDDAIVKHGVLEPGIAFIYKPFAVEALSAKIREVLDGPADKAKA